MDQMIATFRYSIPKGLGIVALGILMTVLSVVILTGAIPSSGPVWLPIRWAVRVCASCCPL